MNMLWKQFRQSMARCAEYVEECCKLQKYSGPLTLNGIHRFEAIWLIRKMLRMRFFPLGCLP